MLNFPDIKINIGLRVTSRRPDGYHNLESLFYPVRGGDILEAVPVEHVDSHGSMPELTITGLEIPGNPRDNLVLRAYRLMQERFGIPLTRFHLHKVIPMGSGLGGGSGNGTYAIKLLNRLYNLGLSSTGIQELAASLGSDCPFFAESRPALVSGRGEIIEPIEFSLLGWYLVLVCPNIHVSTKEAFSKLTPSIPGNSLPELLSHPIHTWKSHIFNDFEPSVFAIHPELSNIREKLYDNGAVYASMSGSGSAIYGLFRQKPCPSQIFPSSYSIFEYQL